MVEWKNNKRARRFASSIDEKEIDKTNSFEWLKRGVLKFDSERIILAAQDDRPNEWAEEDIQANEPTDNDKCRFCHESVETVNRLLSGCPKLLTEGRYTTINNNVCRQGDPLETMPKIRF